MNGACSSGNIRRPAPLLPDNTVSGFKQESHKYTETNLDAGNYPRCPELSLEGGTA